jgi:hypothetical protein
MNRNIAPHFSRIERGLHNHIDELNNRLQAQFCQMYELQSQMHDQVSYLIEQQNQHEPFSCNASFGGSFAMIDVEEKQDEHDNSRNGSNVGNATKEILKRSSGSQLRSNSNATQLKPPAKSQSTSKRSKDQDKISPKPRKIKSHDEEKTEVGYFKKFPKRIRGEPAAVKVGANARLENSDVYCYSNAILQCLASCICLSDFSPSENHPQFPLNHTFASVMNSMVGGETSIDPSLFMDAFMPLYRPPEANIPVNQEGMYHDCA